jgi:anion-transporting  ArsA/GET3 family ATPase
MKRPGLDLRRYQLIACLGPGGVGKTTISAALALSGASQGRAVDVMTVDPAPRLLDALGLDADASEPRTVPLSGARVSHARPGIRARLRALKLDPKRTFDSIVSRYAPSTTARDAILSNRIYRNLSSALAGVGDYMAMEKLLELTSDSATDLVVLDTPPAAEALDFWKRPAGCLISSTRAQSRC